MATEPQSPPVIDKRNPAVLAIEHLAKLAGQGAKPQAMIRALDDVLVRWGQEELPSDELRERVETLQSDLDVGAQAAEDYVAEAQSESAKVQAGKQLEGLQAAQKRLAAVIAA